MYALVISMCCRPAIHTPELSKQSIDSSYQVSKQSFIKLNNFLLNSPELSKQSVDPSYQPSKQSFVQSFSDSVSRLLGLVHGLERLNDFPCQFAFLGH